MAMFRTLLASAGVAVSLGHAHGEGGRAISFGSHGPRQSAVHQLGYTVHSETFRSEALPLAAGEVAFTNPKRTFLPFPSVAGKYAITNFRAEIVDAENKSVPLDEVYLHHWLVYDQAQPNDGVCGGFLDYNFGVGAESRGTPVSFPEGYGYVAAGSQSWGANIHILRTVGLKMRSNYSESVKECIECLYAPEGGKGQGCTEEASGTFACCKDGSQCPADGSVTGKKDYYFLYTVEYTEDVAMVKPLHIFLLDASNCQVEYNIEADEAQPLLKTEYSWHAKFSGSMVFGAGHLHNAGVNITLLQNGKEICSAAPVYGTEEGQPGNEKGYLVAIPTCVSEQDANNAVQVSSGDVVTVRSYYYVGYDDPTGCGLPGGFHGGVMSLFYLGVDLSTMRDTNGQQIDVSQQLELWSPVSSVLQV